MDTDPCCLPGQGIRPLQLFFVGAGFIQPVFQNKKLPGGVPPGSAQKAPAIILYSQAQLQIGLYSAISSFSTAFLCFDVELGIGQVAM